jgi:type I restriction enzyme M protein
MANSAADASGSELEIRRKILEDKSVDVIVSIGSNFFYTVTLPCTLWFFDKGKRKTDRADSVLFIDARKIFNQIDRAHRDFKPEQIEFLANIVRLHRGEKPELVEGSDELVAEAFPDDEYKDVAGLCKVATLAEIEAQGWSLNPGRYAGVAALQDEEFEFSVRLGELSEEMEALNLAAGLLQERIRNSTSFLLGEPQ